MRPSWRNSRGEIQLGFILLLEMGGVKNWGSPMLSQATNYDQAVPTTIALAAFGSGGELEFIFQEQHTLSPVGQIITNSCWHNIDVFCPLHIRHANIYLKIAAVTFLR